MAYDEELANRLREQLAGERGIDEKRMFGGLAFLLGGHMTVSVSGRGGLLVRIDPADTDAALQRPGVVRMEMGGRSMNGWLHVPDPDDAEVAHWTRASLAYVKTLPPKG